MKHWAVYNKILIFIIGGVIGLILGIYYKSQGTLSSPIDVRENSSKYSFINPLLFSRVSKGFYSSEYQVLNDQVTSSISSLINTQSANDISVYFRDLNTGHWTGVNEDRKYHPSSMLKVLGMMSYFRRAEEETGILSRKFYYKTDTDLGQYYKPRYVLQTGFYTIDQLIQQMIVYSDNTVLNILDSEDKNNDFSKIYHTFQLPLVKNIDDIDGFMSPRSYSALFRTLYSATYLSRDDSEKALKLLTTTDFSRGIVAGVPKGISIAHKFGEHTYELTDGEMAKKELHDCGIVYYPQNPYLVCIMTSGSDFPSLEKVISSLSKVVYDYVDKGVKK